MLASWHGGCEKAIRLDIKASYQDGKPEPEHRSPPRDLGKDIPDTEGGIPIFCKGRIQRETLPRYQKAGNSRREEGSKNKNRALRASEVQHVRLR